MRKLIYGINVSIDGCCDHTKMNGNEDVHDYYAQLIRESDTLLYGRKTYELMVPFWPDVAKNNSGGTRSMNDFAKAFDGVKSIVVVSKSLKDVDGSKTRIVRSNLKEEILKLKQEPGGDILLGGVDLPEQLIQLGLVDEYRFVVQPVVVGKGRRVSENILMPEAQQLKLTGTKTFPSGCVALHYAKV